MKITYDKEADAINVILRKGVVAKTLEVASEVMIDVDKKGRPLYIEILGASEKVGKKSFKSLVLNNKIFKIPEFAFSLR